MKGERRKKKGEWGRVNFKKGRDTKDIERDRFVIDRGKGRREQEEQNGLQNGMPKEGEVICQKKV